MSSKKKNTNNKKKETNKNKNKNVNKNNIKITINNTKRKSKGKTASSNTQQKDQGKAMTVFSPSIVNQVQAPEPNYKQLAYDYNTPPKSKPSPPPSTTPPLMNPMIPLRIPTPKKLEPIKKPSVVFEKPKIPAPKNKLSTPMTSDRSKKRLFAGYENEDVINMDISKTPYKSPIKIKQKPIVKSSKEDDFILNKKKYIKLDNFIKQSTSADLRQLTLKNLNTLTQMLTGQKGKFNKETKEEGIKQFCKYFGKPYTPPIIPEAVPIISAPDEPVEVKITPPSPSSPSASSLAPSSPPASSPTRKPKKEYVLTEARKLAFEKAMEKRLL